MPPAWQKAAPHCCALTAGPRSCGLAPFKPHRRSVLAQTAASNASAGIDGSMALPQSLAGLREIAPLYEGVLLDQFGVLHDGQKPYPGAMEAVKGLHEAGLRILIISNSSRRSSGTLGRLSKMGFQEEWFAGKRDPIAPNLLLSTFQLFGINF